MLEACAQVQAHMMLLRDLAPDVANGNSLLPPPVGERALEIVAGLNPKLAAKLRSGEGIPKEQRFSYRALVELKAKLIRSGALVNLDLDAGWGIDVSKAGGAEMLAVMRIADKLK